MELLAREGRRIAVFELEGPIFFGTAEDLARRVEIAAARDSLSHVILDLKRVSEIDSTGARILVQMHDRLQRAGTRLFISHALDDARKHGVLRGAGAMGATARDGIFGDTDAALERAEDLLLRGLVDGLGADEELSPARLPLLAGLTDDERELLAGLLVRRVFAAGDVVIREGDRDRSLYMTAKGTASARIDLPSEGRSKRLATFSPGTVFGEVALLDKEPRSATVVADEELVCYVLPGERFDTLATARPAIAIHLLTTLGKELSQRLRKATAIISQLES
jgi:anti-anti-sigma factor